MVIVELKHDATLMIGSGFARLKKGIKLEKLSSNGNGTINVKIISGKHKGKIFKFNEASVTE